MRSTAALSLLALLSGSRTAMSGACAPRARLDGDRVAVERVAAELHHLGVATEPPPAGCTAVEAAVGLENGGAISVAIRDASRRSEGRVVGDAAVAAAWIDSWVRDDLAGFDEVSAPAMTPPQTQVSETSVADVAPQPARASVFDRLSVHAGYVQAWSDDRSSWSGFDVAGCVHIGFACVGVRADALFQPQVSANQTLAARSDLAALATASATFAIGRMAITPEIGLGIGRLSTSRVDGCSVSTPPNCNPSDPTDPNCKPAPLPNCVDASGALFVGDHLQAATIAPRASAALHLEIPLFDHVWLDGRAAVTLTAFRHGDPYQPAPDGAPSVPGEQVALPGEPLASYQLGIGIRIGAP